MKNPLIEEAAFALGLGIGTMSMFPAHRFCRVGSVRKWSCPRFRRHQLGLQECFKRSSPLDIHSSSILSPTCRLPTPLHSSPLLVEARKRPHWHVRQRGSVGAHRYPLLGEWFLPSSALFCTWKYSEVQKEKKVIGHTVVIQVLPQFHIPMPSRRDMEIALYLISL